MLSNRRWALLAVFLLLVVSALAVATSTAAAQDDDAWLALYWDNVNLAGSPALQRTEPSVSHRWGTGSPDPGISNDRFSARWTNNVTLDAGTYRFTTRSDDGIRVWVDGTQIIDNWTVHPEAVNTAVTELSGGEHQIRVEYFENTGEAVAIVAWERIDQTGAETVSIAPLQGPPGTVLTVQASGFPANALVTVGIGVANAEPAVTKQVVTTAAGTLQTTITVPQDATVGRVWRVLVIRAGESALSRDFTVTAAGQPANVCGNVYIVQSGDWLSRIASRCNTSVEALLAANPTITDPSVISVGQRLVLPGGSDPAAPAVGISPGRGPAGTTVTVNASGFEPNVPATVGIGRRGAEPASSRSVTMNQFGAQETTITVPTTAQAGEPWAVIVRAAGESAVSSTFNVKAGEIVATTDANLRLRAGPSTANQILDVVPRGTTLEVEARTEGNGWIRVTYLGQTGWMARSFVTITGDLSAVPVVNFFTTTNIYLIDLAQGDLGCGDAVVPVAVNIVPTRAPLTAALEQLLASDERFYEQTGFYNALYLSNLSVDQVTIVDGTATIWLSGDLQLGGVCDEPRLEAQLRQTALQYDTVDDVEIFVNGQPLASVL